MVDLEKPRFSVVVLTYARDFLLAEVLERLYQHAGARTDYELLLVDNNPKSAGREALLAQFPASHHFWDGVNKGVVGRNIGIDAARGDYILVVDDDVLMETDDFLSVFERVFDAEPDVGAVTISKHVRGETGKRVDLIPHTSKNVDLSATFLTFRFVGGCVGFRREALREVGGFLPDFFYGMEEIELSYRLIDAGWKIRYSPDVRIEELEHPAGRKPTRESQTDRLTNKYIISWLHMPFPHIVANYAFFTPYIAYRVRGQIKIGSAIAQFARWLGRTNRPLRKPLSRQAQNYIKACGGALWR
jgi:GT2 family glycosyltransferase